MFDLILIKKMKRDIKILTIASIMLLNFTFVYAQVKVINNGNVGIGTNNPITKLQIDGEGLLISNAGKWGRSLWVKVINEDACAYNLWSIPLNKDVFYVSERGYLWSLSGGYIGSDSTLKQNFQAIETPLQKLLKLKGFRFQYKDNEDYRLGFIAQEVEHVFPEVIKDMPDSTKAMAYTDLIPVIVEAMKEQQKQIETLQNIVSLQEADILELKHNCGIEPKTKTGTTNETGSNSDDAALFENTPNPFSVNTEIKFILPAIYSSARIVIYDLQGAELKSYNLTQHGNGSLTVGASELKAGMYLYTLFVNDAVIDTKRMVLTK
jgi:hypothetical protein